jgi:hypothetical protein
MALFLIIALKDSAKRVGPEIEEKFPSKHYKIDDTKWFVQSKLPTAKAVSDYVGITSDDPKASESTGIVVNVKGYFGRGPADMWEWIATQSVEQ